MPHRSSRPTFANWVMVAVFTFATAVQYDEPDPLRWMTSLAAAAAFLLAVLRRLPWWLPVVIGLAALVTAATLAPHVRKMYGPLLVAVMMAALAFTERGH